eukprot:scaffold1701_cov61-Phaeocystis_antarctica.AAC.3
MDEEIAPLAVDGGNYVLVSAHNVVIAQAYNLPEPMLVLRKGMALQVWILIGAGAGAPHIEHGQAGLCEGHCGFGEGVRAQRRHPAEHVRKRGRLEQRGHLEVASREATVQHHRWCCAVAREYWLHPIDEGAEWGADHQPLIRAEQFDRAPREFLSLREVHSPASLWRLYSSGSPLTLSTSKLGLPRPRAKVLSEERDTVCVALRHAAGPQHIVCLSDAERRPRIVACSHQVAAIGCSGDAAKGVLGVCARLLQCVVPVPSTEPRDPQNPGLLTLASSEFAKVLASRQIPVGRCHESGQCLAAALHTRQRGARSTAGQRVKDCAMHVFWLLHEQAHHRRGRLALRREASPSRAGRHAAWLSFEVGC